jgi:hypothetical protein
MSQEGAAEGVEAAPEVAQTNAAQAVKPQPVPPPPLRSGWSDVLRASKAAASAAGGSGSVDATNALEAAASVGNGLPAPEKDSSTSAHSSDSVAGSVSTIGVTRVDGVSGVELGLNEGGAKVSPSAINVANGNSTVDVVAEEASGKEVWGCVLKRAKGWMPAHGRQVGRAPAWPIHAGAQAAACRGTANKAGLDEKGAADRSASGACW